MRFESNELQHQLGLLNIYRENAKLAISQRAAYGTSNVPQIIIHNLTEARDNIAQIKLKLHLHYFYEVDTVPGIDYDDIRMVTVTIPRDTYYQIKSIVEDYGIELPEAE